MKSPQQILYSLTVSYLSMKTLKERARPGPGKVAPPATDHLSCSTGPSDSGGSGGSSGTGDSLDKPTPSHRISAEHSLDKIHFTFIINVLRPELPLLTFRTSSLYVTNVEEATSGRS